MNFRLLEGHSVFLSPTTVEDVQESNWWTWYHDYEITRFNRHGTFPIQKEDEDKFVQGVISDPAAVLFTVRTKGEDKVIGNVTLQNIDLLHRKAELALTIGEPNYLGRTCGLEAAGLILEHGFGRLNLHRIYGGAHEGLSRWVNTLGIFGFRPEGRLRDDFLRDGRYWDTIQMASLAPDFFALKEKRGGKTLSPNLPALLKEISISTKRDANVEVAGHC